MKLPKIDFKNKWNIVMILVLAAVAILSGIFTDRWISSRQPDPIRQQRLDETLGLAERTGITGELALQVNPVNLTAKSGDPINVRLTLKNNSKRNMTISKWLTPAPAAYENNQLPMKQIVKASNKPVGYRGNIVLFLSHKKKDFMRLTSGQSYSFDVDLTKGPDDGRWNMSTPGKYSVELWYETYLTGKYSGVRAWTGMTNHVVVKVTVLPGK
ncbi:MAG: hypothetical protein ACYC0V_16620 [Armatimonadota bacterium]